MREIKFRGLYNGKWYYGSLEQHYNDKVSYITWKGQTLGENLGVISDVDFSQEVEFDSVGQYIGLKDKNKKEIYGGDIVKHPYHGISDVFYRNGGYKIHGSYSVVGFGTLAKKSEIIGNGTENPKLLVKE